MMQKRGTIGRSALYWIAVAIMATASGAAAETPRAGRLVVGMPATEAAALLGSPTVSAEGRQVYADGPVAAIACSGVVIAVQEDIGSTETDYDQAAAELTQRFGEGRTEADGIAQTPGDYGLNSTYWDVGDREIVLVRLSAPGFTRVLRTVQLTGAPGCD